MEGGCRCRQATAAAPLAAAPRPPARALAAGAVAALARLRQAGVRTLFCTNTTKDTVANLTALLEGMGFPSVPILSSLAAARRLVDARGLRPLLLLHPDALPEFEGVPREDPNAVVVGLAREAFEYSVMNAAFRLLLRDPKAPLIAAHRGLYYKEPDGLSLGPGPFVTALEVATGREAEVVGKPALTFFHAALEELGCEAAATVMIGDDVRDDVGGAQQAGMRGVLVQTGKQGVRSCALGDGG